MTDRFTSKSAALSYTGEGAPRLVAKGEGELAEKIKAIANELDIPTVAGGPRRIVMPNSAWGRNSPCLICRGR